MAATALTREEIDGIDGGAPATMATADLSAAELAELFDLSQGISGSLGLQQVLDNVVSAARKLLRTDVSTLLLIDEGGERLTVAASVGLDVDVARRLATPVGKNLSGLVAQTGRAARCGDVAQDPRTTLQSVCAAGDMTAGLLVPIRHDARVLGVLVVESRRPREFSDREECILQLLANHAATAIQTASLYTAELHRAEQLNAQNETMRRSREAHDRLSEVALEGVGHAALLRVLVELVPTPVVLINQFGSTLSSATHQSADELDELWQRCSETQALGRQLEHLRESVGPSRRSPVLDEGFWRLVPVVAAGELIGAIVALEPQALESLHLVVLEEAASILAAELMRERSIAAVEARAHGDLVRTLVSADGWGDQARDRAALLGHDLTSEQCVVAVSTGSSEDDDPAAVRASVRHAAARAGLHCLAGRVDGALAVVLTSGDRQLSRESVEQWIVDLGTHLHAADPRLQLRFGVSPIPCTAAEIAQGFSQARQALSVCGLGAGRDVTYFDEVDLIATLIDITNQGAVARFIEQTVGKLIEYDGRKRTDLARTLETYLDCSGVARHAARDLYLHPHSLRYRLRRISEVQGLDLEDPMTRLSAHLALKLRALITPPQ